MPIKGLSEARRLPRLGKIHTGIKKTNAAGKEYPVAVDYFVFPPEWLDRVKNIYGTDKPRQLPILIPVEDEEKWANQYYRLYSKTRGLICKGNGETATRLVDAETGEWAWKDDARQVVMKEVSCRARECPDYVEKRCKEIMMLQFLLPDLPGLGVWQIDTGSINAIININSMAELLKSVYGRVSMIPLMLALEPQTVKTPDGKQRKMPIMRLEVRETLKGMQKLLSQPMFGALGALPEGKVEIEYPNEDYPEMIAPDAQAPKGDEPEPEIDMPAAAPIVTMPEAKCRKGKVETWADFMLIAEKITKARVPSKIAGMLGCRNLSEWTGSKEAALDELAKLCGFEGDWREL